MVFQAAGIVLFLGVQPGTGAAGAGVRADGLGGSLCSSTAQTLAFQGMADEDLMPASALWNLNRQLSFCLAAALLACVLAVLTARLPDHALPSPCCWPAGMSLLPLPLLWRLPASLTLEPT